MKLNLTSNGKKYNLSLWRCVLDFFFPCQDRIGLKIYKNYVFIKIRKGKNVWVKQQPIRAESRTHLDFKSGKISREFYTFRAFWAYCKYMPMFVLRENAERLAKTLNVSPNLAFRLGAVAFNATVNAIIGGTVSSVTLAHTVGSGANRMLFSGAGYSDANASVSSGTYAGAALTSSVSFFDSAANNGRIHILYKIAPATGANDCVLTFSQATAAGDRGGFGVIDYTGVDQTSPIDITGTGTSGAAGVTSLDITLATTVANDWILNTVWWGGGGTLTVGQAETVRWNRTDAGVQNGGADKATTTTGSYLTGWDASTSNSVVMGAVAFKPARPAPVTTAPTLLMMGVG